MTFPIFSIANLTATSVHWATFQADNLDVNWLDWHLVKVSTLHYITYNFKFLSEK